MGIAVDDVKKAVKFRGKAVELRAGASEPHQTQPDYISKLHLPITFHQHLGDNDTNEECVTLSAACGLYHYNRDVENDLNKMSTSQTSQRGNITRQSRMTMKTLRSMLHKLSIKFKPINGGVAIKDFCSGPRFSSGGLFFWESCRLEWYSWALCGP